MAVTPPLPCKLVANLECAWPNCKCYPSETKLVETPRTDALYVSPLDSNDVYAWQTLARQLERELADVKAMMQPGQVDAVIEGIRTRDAALASLADELRLAREDARRYRWLREARLPPTTVLTVVTNRGYGLWAKALDNAIDEALKDAASSGPKEVE